jgi:hypothetical protein
MDEAQVNSLIGAASGEGTSVWSDIGGLYEQRAFQRRVDALTDPVAYATKRAAALDKIKNASVAAYKTSYAGYISAGLSPEMAKMNATNSAQSEYHNQQNVFNLEYGQGTDQIFQGSSANKGTMGTQGTLAQAAPRARARRAPARRAPAARSAASRSAAAKKGAATKRRNAKKK